MIYNKQNEEMKVTFVDLINGFRVSMDTTQTKILTLNTNTLIFTHGKLSSHKTVLSLSGGNLTMTMMFSS